MKLVKLVDTPLSVVQREVERARQYAQVVLEYDEQWQLLRADSVHYQPDNNLAVIAVIGQTKQGPAAVAEIGMRQALPYRRTHKTDRQKIAFPNRSKFSDIEINWDRVVFTLTKVMNLIAAERIGSWTGWKKSLGKKVAYARSLKQTGVKYVDKRWLPPPEGIIFTVSEFDWPLIEMFLNTQYLTNMRIRRRIEGVLGVFHIIQKHFHLPKLSRRKADDLRELLADSSVAEFIADEELFKATLVYQNISHRRTIALLGGENLLMYLRQAGYLSIAQHRLFHNYYTDFWSAEENLFKREQARQQLANKTNHIQIQLLNIKARKDFTQQPNSPNRLVTRYYSFKVFADQLEDKNQKSIFNQTGEVPF